MSSLKKVKAELENCALGSNKELVERNETLSQMLVVARAEIEELKKPVNKQVINELRVPYNGIMLDVGFTFTPLGNGAYDIDVTSMTTEDDVAVLIEAEVAELEEVVISAIITGHKKGLNP